jgi:hypothetical protein
MHCTQSEHPLPLPLHQISNRMMRRASALWGAGRSLERPVPIGRNRLPPVAVAEGMQAPARTPMTALLPNHGHSHNISSNYMPKVGQMTQQRKRALPSRPTSRHVSCVSFISSTYACLQAPRQTRHHPRAGPAWGPSGETGMSQRQHRALRRAVRLWPIHSSRAECHARLPDAEAP